MPYKTKVFTGIQDVWRMKIEKAEYFYTSKNLQCVSEMIKETEQDRHTHTHTLGG